MERTSDTWNVPQIHGTYLRYIDFVRRWQTKLLDTWKVPQIHGRYMEGTSDTWKVPQIHGRYLRHTEGTSDTYTSSEGGRPNFLIHGRYLRYMEGTSDTWKVPQIHGRYLRYMDFIREVFRYWWDPPRKETSGQVEFDPRSAALEEDALPLGHRGSFAGLVS